jgi:hypothetical protein
MGKIFLIIIVISLVLLTNSSCYAANIDGPYKGRVIDAETGKPVEGVVVLGVWYTETPTVAGAISHYYDAMETVTDKNGEFYISGKGFVVMTYMNVLVFKAGYEYFDSLWVSLKRSQYLIEKKKIKWEGEKAIIPLKKLTMEERRKQGTPDFYVGERYDKKENITHSCLPQNINLLPKEVNKELVEQGRKPYNLEKGRCEK